MHQSKCFTWMQIEMIIPIIVTSRSGTNKNQMNDDSKSAQSHTNAAATKIMIRIGSWATVMVNMANGGPKARKAQPKNSGKVILLCPTKLMWCVLFMEINTGDISTEGGRKHNGTPKIWERNENVLLKIKNWYYYSSIKSLNLMFGPHFAWKTKWNFLKCLIIGWIFFSLFADSFLLFYDLFICLPVSLMQFLIRLTFIHVSLIDGNMFTVDGFCMRRTLSIHSMKFNNFVCNNFMIYSSHSYNSNWFVFNGQTPKYMHLSVNCKFSYNKSLVFVAINGWVQRYKMLRSSGPERDDYSHLTRIK